MNRLLVRVSAFIVVCVCVVIPAHAQEILVGSQRHAVVGRSMVVRVDPGAVPDGALSLRLGDGTELAATVERFALTQREGAGGPLSVWLGGDVVLTPDSQGPIALAVCAIPEDAPLGAAWLSGSVRVELVEPISDDTLWIVRRIADAARDDVARDAWRDEAVAVLARDPREWWRALLLLGDLADPEQISGDAFEHPVLAAYAQQEFELWRVALATLGASSPALAEDVVRRIAGAATFGQSVRAPAWTPGGQRLDALRSMLLSGGDALLLEERIASWLETQSALLAWIESDAGDGALRTPIIAVMRLGASPLLCTFEGVDRSGESGPPSSVVAPPGEVVFAAATEPIDGGLIERIELRTPETSRSLGVIPPFPARPPGVTLRPAIADWSLDTWISQSSPESAPGGVYLWRDKSLSSGFVWRALIETPPDADMRIWIGARGRETAVLRIDQEGGLTTELGEAGARVIGAGATPTSRWAMLEFPATGLGGSEAQLAYEILGERGKRWVWPRPLFPWERSPSRVRLDLSDWNALGGSSGTRSPR